MVLLLLLRVADDERVALLVLPERISLLDREFIWPDVVLPLLPRVTFAVRDAGWLLLVEAARVVDELTDLFALFVVVLDCDARPRTAVALPDDELPAPPPIDDDAARAELPPWPNSPLSRRSLATPLAVVRRRP